MFRGIMRENVRDGFSKMKLLVGPARQPPLLYLYFYLSHTHMLSFLRYGAWL